MSKEEDKIKRSTRLYLDEVAIAKQVKIAKAHGIKVKEPHTLVKHKAMDCGQPGCVKCGNARKIEGATVQEKSFMQTEGWND